jgi:hypothetical protein
VLKLYSTVVGGFTQGGTNLYGLELPVQRLVGYRAGGKNAGVYGRFRPKQEQFWSCWATGAIYANRAKPHKH